MNFLLLGSTYSIYKFRDICALPAWIYKSDFFSITSTPDELSVVSVQSDNVPKDIVCSRNWRILKVEGPLDLSLTGIIAEISLILKDRNIPIFTISTYDTDYVLVKQNDLNKAVEALVEKNHNIHKQ